VPKSDAASDREGETRVGGTGLGWQQTMAPCWHSDGNGPNKPSAGAACGPSASLQDPMGEWQLASDLEQQLFFPAEIVATTLRPNIVIWSLQLKSVLIEFTVPLETNMDVAHDRKLRRYEDLVAQCRVRGWRCEIFAVEVGARGFVCGSALSLLRRVGFGGAMLPGNSPGVGRCSRGR